MATVTLSARAAHRSLAPTPYISSPLASSDQRAAPSPSRRHSIFPSSRPLRPFPSLYVSRPAHVTVSTGQKPLKLIEPPQNHEGTFVLNLTQAELSRKD